MRKRDTGSGRVFSLDASSGLLITRWRLWRQSASSALRSAFVVEWYVMKNVQNNKTNGIIFWLYLDAEVLVLPPVFYPQDSCFVGRQLFVVNQLSTGILGIPLPALLSNTVFMHRPPWLLCRVHDMKKKKKKHGIISPC